MPHPKLDIYCFLTRFPASLSEVATPTEVLRMLTTDADAPLQSDDSIRKSVRDMLRVHGYKPSGRGKPASEYLLKADAEDGLGSINLAVDACNVVSLHSGFPISVVDLDRTHPPLAISVAGEGSAYVFNASGQQIRLDGLPCLFDANGPCANAVRDSERTKTQADTITTLSVIWGTLQHSDRAATAAAWYRRLLARAGAETTAVPLQTG